MYEPLASLAKSEVRRTRTPPEKLLVDTATYPMGSAEGARVAAKAVKDDETVTPLAISKTFDSFDATLRLAAMTDQTEDFREYITQTSKMRAYRGKIEPGSPLAKEEPQQEAPRIVFDNPVLTGSGPSPVGGTSTTNLIAFGAIVILAIAVVALLIALLVK